MDARTHDYTVRGWGHDFGISNSGHAGFELDAYGWGVGVKPGDLLILPNGDHATQYRVETIRYQAEPPDMWFARLMFAPRSDPATRPGG